MEHYYSVEEISKEIGISRQNLTKRIKKMGVDTKKIDENTKKAIIDDCFDEINKKNTKNMILNVINGVSEVKSSEISNESGSTLLKRLEIAKQKYDFVNECLAILEIEIKELGILINNANTSVSSNPAVKSWNELTKSQNVYQKQIDDLEEKLKLSRSTEDEKRSVIGDE